MLDVLVIGGGPSGLSAAIMLGRCRRSVVVCDAGTPRNGASRALHGFLTRDGCAPAALLEHGRSELARYEIGWRGARVDTVERTDSGFVAGLENGEQLLARKLLIATGVTDHLPEAEGFDRCYGRSVFHCPYCDGWEWRERRLGVYGRGTAGAALALSLLTWSAGVRLLTDGPARLGTASRARLLERGVHLDQRRLAALEHEDGLVRSVAFGNGDREPIDAIFFTEGQRQQAPFAAALGCDFTRKGTVRTDRYGQTNVPGVFVVGDASHDVQFVVVAAAEGTKAAVALNKQFQAEAGDVPPSE